MTRAVVLAAALLAGVGVAAQAPAPGRAQPFRAGTLVVEVDTIVTDGSGAFVPSLGADDFELLEDGKPQRIDYLYAVTGATVRAPASGAGAPETSGPAIPRTAPARVFVLVFDQEHMQEASFKRLREAAIAFLTDEFKAGDVGGVVIGSTMAGNRLTSDREALLAAVRDARPDFSKSSRKLTLLEWPRFNSEAEAVRIADANDRDVLAQVVRRACSDDPGACKQIDPEPIVRGKAQTIVGDLRPPAMRTLRTLQALSSGLARMPGRKTVVLMTDGFFLEESTGELRQIVGAAARSNVRFYSLDARGLDSRPVNDPRQLGPMDPGGSLPLGAYDTTEDGPNALAADTGGYAIRHTNKFAAALSEIARDASSYYVIGYSPSNGAMDGAFRRITVRVTRRGLKARSRRGYLALPPAPAGAAPASTDEAPSPAAAAPVSPPTASAPPAASTPAAAVKAEPPAASVAPAPAAATPAGPATPSAASAGTITLRPDAGARVQSLAGGAVGAASLEARGWERYQKGDLEGASDLLGKAAAAPGARPWVRYALGYAEVALRRTDDAIHQWERVRAEVPEFRPVYLDLADAYAQTGNHGRATAVLHAAESRWPADPDTLNALGTLAVRRGALDEAIRTFRRAADGGDALACFNLARTYELRYFKTRRYVPSDSQWIGNKQDVKDAVASYERYLQLGGPFAGDARNALQNLRWIQ